MFTQPAGSTALRGAQPHPAPAQQPPRSAAHGVSAGGAQGAADSPKAWVIRPAPEPSAQGRPSHPVCQALVGLPPCAALCPLWVHSASTLGPLVKVFVKLPLHLGAAEVEGRTAVYTWLPAETRGLSWAVPTAAPRNGRAPTSGDPAQPFP